LTPLDAVGLYDDRWLSFLQIDKRQALHVVKLRLFLQTKPILFLVILLQRSILSHLHLYDCVFTHVQVVEDQEIVPEADLLALDVAVLENLGDFPLVALHAIYLNFFICAVHY